LKGITPMSDEETTDEKIKEAILRELTVPLWPHAGRELGLAKNPTYEGGRRGEIPCIRIGGRFRTPTAALRRMPGIEPEAH
jgi:hypothetical protein